MLKITNKILKTTEIHRKYEENEDLHKDFHSSIEFKYNINPKFNKLKKLELFFNSFTQKFTLKVKSFKNIKQSL